MTVRAFLEQLIHTPASGESYRRRLLLLPLYLISHIYRLFVTVRNILYRTGVKRSHRLPCPVVSIGNITLGGTGKTPAVIYLARLFQRRGMRPAVLSRGYRSTSPEKIAVVSDGEKILLDAGDAGDEAVLLAGALPGVPVIIGPDRTRSGRFASERFSPEIIILDDGFQHLRVKREADIVLVDLSRGFGNGYLLPRGVLREPVSALGRAHLILLTKKTGAADEHTLEEQIRRDHPETPVFNTRYEVQSLTELHTGRRLDPGQLKGQRVLALSGIGNPHYFSFLLARAGLSVTDEVILPDHHHYSAEDASMLHNRLASVDSIITTAKDSCKMDRKVFHDLPILTLQVVLKVSEERQFENALFRNLPGIMPEG